MPASADSITAPGLRPDVTHGAPGGSGAGQPPGDFQTFAKREVTDAAVILQGSLGTSSAFTASLAMMDGSAGTSEVLGCSDAGAQKDRVVTEEEWRQKWAMGNTGFHKEQVHPYVSSLPKVFTKRCSGMSDLELQNSFSWRRSFKMLSPALNPALAGHH